MNLKGLIIEVERLLKENAGLRMKDWKFQENSYVISGIKQTVEAVKPNLDNHFEGLVGYDCEDWQKLKKLLGVR